jgi:hypothetical protein
MLGGCGLLVVALPIKRGRAFAAEGWACLLLLLRMVRSGAENACTRHGLYDSHIAFTFAECAQANGTSNRLLRTRTFESRAPSDLCRRSLLRSGTPGTERSYLMFLPCSIREQRLQAGYAYIAAIDTFLGSRV